MFDDNVLECHPDYEKEYDPIITVDDYSNSFGRFKEALSGMKVKSVLVSEESIEISLLDSCEALHSIKSYKYSDKFPEQGGTGKKRNSYEMGEMKDYWLITYDGTHLMI